MIEITETLVNYESYDMFLHVIDNLRKESNETIIVKNSIVFDSCDLSRFPNLETKDNTVNITLDRCYGNVPKERGTIISINGGTLFLMNMTINFCSITDTGDFSMSCESNK